MKPTKDDVIVAAQLDQFGLKRKLMELEQQIEAVIDPFREQELLNQFLLTQEELRESEYNWC